MQASLISMNVTTRRNSIGNAAIKNIKMIFASIIILFSANNQSARALDDGKQILEMLRSQLKYKFVLDYLVQSQGNANIYSDIEKYSNSVKIIPLMNTNAI